jgi:cysteine desulfurase/selenocysteine lyase
MPLRLGNATSLVPPAHAEAPGLIARPTVPSPDISVPSAQSGRSSALPDAGYYFLETIHPEASSTPPPAFTQPPSSLDALPRGLDSVMSTIPTMPAAAAPTDFSSPPASLPEQPQSSVGKSGAVGNRTDPAALPDRNSIPWTLELPPESVPDLGPTVRLPFNPLTAKNDFPILREKVHGRPLVWLDNAATTQKPQAVIDRLSYFYAHENSNIHRAAHTLAARATDAYEAAREKVRRFLGAGSTDNIIFVRGATEGINLVAQAWGRHNIEKGDEIVITWLEHHANIVPWQQLCAEKGARLRVAPVDDSGQILLEDYEKLLGPRTRIVALTQVSNALGTVTPVQPMIEMAHSHGACVLVDGAQAVSHMPVDVQALDCDFYVFSGHKVFGPTGIGVLYGKPEVLAAMPPWQGGGNMIADVTFEKTVYQPPPARFEAGTGNIADAVGLGAAIDYVEAIGMANIATYEHGLLVYGTERLLTVPGLTLIGTAAEKAGVLSFVLDDIPPEEVGQALDREGIAVRSGHHCAQPILRRFGLESTVRPSLAFYNTCEDIDALVAALLRLPRSSSRTPKSGR